MMRWFRNMLLGMMILLAGVQAAAQAQALTEDPKTLTPSPGKSLIYFYYSRQSLTGKTEVALDEMVSPIGKKTFAVWEVAPGKHVMTFTFQRLFGSFDKYPTKITCEPDRIYFYRLFPYTDTTNSSTGVAAYRFMTSSEEAGRKAIRKYRLAGWFKDGNVIYLDQALKEKWDKKEKEDKQEAEKTPETPHDIEDEESEEQPATQAPVNAPTPEQLDAQAETPQAKAAGQCYALMIGIAKYAELEPLPTAVNDAEAVADVLRAKYGCSVQTVLNEKATREGILDTLSVFQKLLKPEDALVMYYAGRSRLDADSQLAYWLPADAKQDSMTQWLGVDMITAMLKQIPARHVLILADSRYSGMLTKACLADLANPAMRAQAIEQLQAKPARIALTSGADQPIGKTGQHLSLFASAVVAALTEPRAPLFPAEELFQAVFESVAGQSDQTPEFGAIRNSGHDGGDVVLQAQ